MEPARRDVAIVGYAQSPSTRRSDGRNDVELLMPVVAEAIARSGIPKKQIDFTVSGSSDFLSGIPFSFVSALDAIGAWPPISESHVEMDGAFALYEAWVRLQHGDMDTALLYAFGQSSNCSIRDVLTLQLDPYYQAPLGIDAVEIAALQARAYLDAQTASGRKRSEKDFAEVAAANRKRALANPFAQLKGEFSIEQILAEPYLAAPLRKHDCPPISDGAVAVVLAVGDVARRACKRPAWIRGIDHRIEPHALGVRDLARSPSTTVAARKAGAFEEKLEVVELHAPFSHQELILREALSLPYSDGAEGNDGVRINPSGGAMAGNPVMAAGLIALVAAARQISEHGVSRALGHATSGPCLQQNLVCVFGDEPRAHPTATNPEASLAQGDELPR